jgi:hypothetical protein
MELMTPALLDKNNACPDFACQLTTQDLALRKATVLTSLKKDILECTETATGYLYKFNGVDTMIDQLCEFVKTERQCCDFFTFTLTIQKETSFIFLEIAGPEGAKEFIKSELGL